MFVKLAPTLGKPSKKKRSNGKKTIFMKCQECGIYFETPSYMKGKRKYCSRTCGSRAYNRTRKIHTIKTEKCLLCGDEFTFKSFPNKKDQRFCCVDCANRYNRSKDYEKRYEEKIKEVERDYEELMRNV